MIKNTRLSNNDFKALRSLQKFGPIFDSGHIHIFWKGNRGKWTQIIRSKHPIEFDEAIKALRNLEFHGLALYETGCMCSDPYCAQKKSQGYDRWSITKDGRYLLDRANKSTIDISKTTIDIACTRQNNYSFFQRFFGRSVN